MKYELLLAAVLVVFIAAGYGVQQALGAARVSTVSSTVQCPEEQLFKPVTMELPAVDEDGNGVMIPLTVELKRGNGKVLMNIDNPSFIYDTQDSMRLAVREASVISGYGVNSTDVIFSFSTNASIVGGPSAGAAMTIATIVALTGEDLKEGVAITGQIGEGGKVLPVGAIKEKAQAAKAAGIKVFVIPKGENMISEPMQNCTEKRTANTYEKRCYVTNTYANVTDVVKGIDIKEAATIDEALEYMLA